MEIALYQLGDSWSARKLTKTMGATPYIFGVGYSQFSIRNFKRDMVTKEVSANVVAIGSSRVMQLREWAFLPLLGQNRRSFYNAGGPLVGSPATFLIYAKALQAPVPKVVILGIDSWSLSGNPNLSHHKKLLMDFGVYDEVKRVSRFVEESQNFLKQQLSGYELFLKDFRRWIPLLFKARTPVPVSQLWPVGVAAQLAHIGFRTDGSYEYGKYQLLKTIPEDWKAKLEVETDDEFAKGHQPFGPWLGVGWGALHDLAETLDVLHSKGIYAILILPPYSDQVNLVFETKYRGSFDSIRASLRDLLKNRQDAVLYDFSKLSNIGCGSDEMLDFVHPSERCMAKLTLQLSSDPVLGPLIDQPGIKQALSKATNPYYVFPSYPQLNN